MDQTRARLLKSGKDGGDVLYWMSRDQRADDNWALIFARDLAKKNDSDLATVFCEVSDYPNAQKAHYDLMHSGLSTVDSILSELGTPFEIVRSTADSAPEKIAEYAEDFSTIVTDFDPLRLKRSWKGGLIGQTDCTVYEVDAHNIVPCWIASDKKEWSAYTFRRKMSRILPNFLDRFPEKTPIHPKLKDFIENRLNDYSKKRNDPTEDGQSNLSPYLHFGQISAQRVALEVNSAKANQESKDAFVEELIIRRELSDNYCYYEPEYDSFGGFEPWAKKTLAEHESDPREYVYSKSEFEDAKAHDPLWNAAQNQMMRTGKMHGYMRMYWAKKILEWTNSPPEALDIAIYLNDKYELDGRDPNGYAGIAWSIGGIHDRAWGKRAIFGKIRYMNYAGCKRKFDVEEYISKNI